jgi:hypothetical protein
MREHGIYREHWQAQFLAFSAAGAVAVGPAFNSSAMPGENWRMTRNQNRPVYFSISHFGLARLI